MTDVTPIEPPKLVGSASLRTAYYKARRARMAAREHYDATVCEEQRLAQRLWKLLRPADTDGA